MKTFLALVLATVGLAGTAAAQGVPKIDITRSCKQATTQAGIKQDFESCRRSEMNAHATLTKLWDSFAAGDRSRCYNLTTTGTPGTYTELLTCLEMFRDARKIPESKGDHPLGQ